MKNILYFGILPVEMQGFASEQEMQTKNGQ